uniref:Uncharacterized protein n=1 Tax=Sphaerodactylus townsendi TaxID=933632 RepID=A0ACB8G2M4_9SAUR
MSAPGGPSGGREPSSHELKGPLVATVGGFQEEDGGLLPFAATQEEEALQAMEPLPSVGQSAPPAQPCISFSEDAQMQTIVSSWENEYALDLVQESRTSDVDPLREVEHDPSSGWLDKLLASPPPSADDTKRRSTPKLDDPTGPEVKECMGSWLRPTKWVACRRCHWSFHSVIFKTSMEWVKRIKKVARWVCIPAWLGNRLGLPL